MLKTGYFPILDHDDDQMDVISVSRGLSKNFPKIGLLAILGNKVDQLAQNSDAEQVGEINFITKTIPIWKISRQGRSIVVIDCPIGAPAAVMSAENLIRGGVEKLICVGSCGTLLPLDEGDFFVPTRALRDEGTSYHYQSPSIYTYTDQEINQSILAVVEKNGLSAKCGTTWTTDAFYRETSSVIELRREQGCQVVEMECSALASCAAFRGAKFGQLLFTADSLASEVYQKRGFGVGCHELALNLAVDAAFELATK